MIRDEQEAGNLAGGPERPRGAALRRLLARAQRLKAGLVVGRDGLSPAFVSEVDRELGDHGLLKVRLDVEDRRAADEEAGALAAAAHAVLLKRIGRVAVLYRPEDS